MARQLAVAAALLCLGERRAWLRSPPGHRNAVASGLHRPGGPSGRAASLGCARNSCSVAPRAPHTGCASPRSCGMAGIRCIAAPRAGVGHPPLPDPAAACPPSRGTGAALGPLARAQLPTSDPQRLVDNLKFIKQEVLPDPNMKVWMVMKVRHERHRSSGRRSSCGGQLLHRLFAVCFEPFHCFAAKWCSASAGWGLHCKRGSSNASNACYASPICHHACRAVDAAMSVMAGQLEVTAGYKTRTTDASHPPFQPVRPLQTAKVPTASHVCLPCRSGTPTATASATWPARRPRQQTALRCTTTARRPRWLTRPRPPGRQRLPCCASCPPPSARLRTRCKWA